MPVFRYFFVVGAVLIALLLAIDALKPNPQIQVSSGERDVDKSTIRIAAERKGPEAVVFDTQAPLRKLVPVDKPIPVDAAQDPTPAPTVAAVDEIPPVEAVNETPETVVQTAAPKAPHKKSRVARNPPRERLVAAAPMERPWQPIWRVFGGWVP